MTIFFRVLDPSVDEKPEALLAAVRGVSASKPPRADVPVFDLSPNAFRKVPGSPFAYWVSDRLLSLFAPAPKSTRPRLMAKQGLSTVNDFRFARLWWEIAGSIGKRWFPFAKGGAHSRIYVDPHLEVNWHDKGREIYVYNGIPLGFAGAPIRNPEHYFRAGLTWPRRTDGLSFRILPAGCIFADKGPAAFVENDDTEMLLALSAIMNSRAYGYLVTVQLARTELAQSYEVGLIQQTPIPNLSPKDTSSLAGLARRAWSLKRSIDTSNETSHAFLLPPGLNEKVTGRDQGSIELELEAIHRQIDEAAYALYCIGQEDRTSIEAWAAGAGSIEKSDGGKTEADEGSDEETSSAFGVEAVQICSWLVGVAVGRFDFRLATELVEACTISDGTQYTLLRGQRSVPPEPAPFDPLPTRSPGMWPENELPNVVPRDIMVDDLGHDDDLCTNVANAAANAGVPVSEDLRQWLAKDFFPLHIKMYSKSRRKAPIYWQLATPSASYSAWLYIHAFSKDTLFRVQNDYSAPKLAHEERRLDSLTNELHDGATATQRKVLTAQESLVEELRGFLDEVKRVAPLWNPNLDDGVVINFAPLWRLVPQNKSWQKELKSIWDTLCEGGYDWAHLAMHLWPERVVPKCAKDHSVAIAHGLEDVFWIEGTDGKWVTRKTPVRIIEELVFERTSTAVKSALKSLLEAPGVAGAGARTKKGKAGA